MVSLGKEFLIAYSNEPPHPGEATPLDTSGGVNHHFYLTQQDQAFVESLITWASNDDDISSLSFERTSRQKTTDVIRVFFSR